MTFTSVVAQANSKTAEFARLFELFDRVATRRARALAGDNSEVISTDDIANVPAEFAPVLKNISAILSLRARRAQAVSQTRSRHGTLTADNTMPQVDVMRSPEAQNERGFPPGQRYPFTFKLMLHKLYDLDEWIEKVETAVEASKSQFKHLAEQAHTIVLGSSAGSTTSAKEQGERRGRGNVHPILGASAKFKPPSSARKTYPSAAGLSRDASASIREGEKRSSVRPVLGASAKFKPPSASRYPRSAATPAKREAGRVLKKRCIGRRKSINGPTGVWVYDAAISAIEVAGPRSAVEITLSTPRGYGAGGVADRARHRSLTAVEEMQGRDTAKRRIKITVSLPQEEHAEAIPPQVLVTETGSVVKKKRSMVSSFASESCKRAAVKRPLCI